MLSYIALFTTFASYTVQSKKKSSYTYCDDYLECLNSSISTTYADCFGYQGCKSSDISSSHTLAYGELACYGADIDSEYSYAYGHYGTYSSSVSTKNMYAYGYKATGIADIEPYSNELDIYFYGYYGGWKSAVSCYSGDTCSLYCGSSSGCSGVDFYCYSGATCYYDCSGDNVCPTTYTGVESELTYVTKVGTGTSTSGDYLSQAQGDAEGEDNAENDNEQDPNADQIPVDIRSDVTIVAGLTDFEIDEIKRANQLAKDTSLDKLDDVTIADTNDQLRMTIDMELWYTGELLRKAQEERDELNERAREREENTNIYKREEEHEKHEKQVKLAKATQKGWYKNSKHFDKNAGKQGLLLFGISLNEYGIALIIDVCIIAVIMQGYNYYNKAKEYQQI